MTEDDPSITERECESCGVTGEHVVTGDRVVCTNCGTTDGDPGICTYEGCPDPATHMLMVNPTGRPRVVEYYCEEHADVAASEARTATDRELFYGPLEMHTE